MIWKTGTAKEDKFSRIIMENLVVRDLGGTHMEERILAIERICRKEGIRDGSFHFDYPLSVYSMDIRYDGQTHVCEVELSWRDKDSPTGRRSVIMNRERQIARYFEHAKRINEIMDREHLVITDEYSPDFANAILKAEPGDFLVFSSQYAICCTGKGKNEITFKEQYTGDISHIKADSFCNSRTFVVNSPKSMQYLYRHACTKNLTLAELRKSTRTDTGYHYVVMVEDSIKSESGMVNVHIGDLSLYVMRKNGQYQWYDHDGHKLSRDRVAIMYAWAKHSQVDMRIIHKENSADSLVTDAAFIHEIKELAAKNLAAEITDAAFRYAEASGHTAYLQVKGLEDDGKGNFLSVAFAFQEIDGERRILRICYDNNHFPEENGLFGIQSVEQVLPEDFQAFINDKYNEEYLHFKTVYEEHIKKYLEEHREKLFADVASELQKRLYRSGKAYPIVHPVNAVSTDIDTLIASVSSGMNREEFTLNELIDYDPNGQENEKTDRGG